MLTKPYAKAFYTKFCSTSPAFLRSKKGKELIAKALKMVREQDGDDEAVVLENLLTVAACPILD